MILVHLSQSRLFSLEHAVDFGITKVDLERLHVEPL